MAASVDPYIVDPKSDKECRVVLGQIDLSADDLESLVDMTEGFIEEGLWDEVGKHAICLRTPKEIEELHCKLKILLNRVNTVKSTIVI